MIYFIRNRAGRVKIGYTYDAKTYKARMSSYAGHMGEQPDVLAVMPGDTGIEGGLHARFDDFRVTHEWFMPCDELCDLIESLDYTVDDVVRIEEHKRESAADAIDKVSQSDANMHESAIALIRMALSVFSSVMTEEHVDAMSGLGQLHEWTVDEVWLMANHTKNLVLTNMWQEVSHGATVKAIIGYHYDEIHYDLFHETAANLATDERMQGMLAAFDKGTQR